MSVLPALMAGCSGPDGLLTADEAIAEALERSPGATLVGVYGVEGPQLQVELPRLAFRDDGLDDGTFGDGRLSSWVVGLRLNDSLVERRIYGDGRPATFFEGDVPEFFQDMQVFVDTSRHLDSPQATAAAMEACDLAPFASGPTGYLYSFSLYDEVPTRGSPWWFRESGAIPFETLGFATAANTWNVVRVDLAPGSDHLATEARFPANDASKASCRSAQPRSSTQVFWASDFWTEPPAKSEPALYAYPFEVGERAVRVYGYFHVQGHDQTPPGMHPPFPVATPPLGRLRGGRMVSRRHRRGRGWHRAGELAARGALRWPGRPADARRRRALGHRTPAALSTA
jgi:hypothetical protein